MITTKYLHALVTGLGLTSRSVVSADNVPERFIFTQVVGATPLASQRATASERATVTISSIAPSRAQADADALKVMGELERSYEEDVPYAGHSPSYLKVTALPTMLPEVSAANLDKASYQYSMTVTLVFQT